LAILPSGIVKVMGVFPFYYISYLPAMLLLGRNGNEISVGLITLILWNTAFWILNSATYGKLRSKYDGVGI
jgi:ABC-2 type transport system permease protein